MKEFFNQHKLLIAPMAGISDSVFRSLCLEQGASLGYSEMVSAKGLSYNSEKTRHLLELAKNESQVVVQLFGHEPHVVAAQAAWVEDVLGKRLAYIDLNMGCPARKIVSKGDGSALMKNPDLACAIIRETVRTISHKVTVKFRRGYALGQESAPEFAKRMEDAGANALCIHGRYTEQLYHGRANWDVIARVKDVVSVPVVGNGDVCSGSDALSLVSQTGCDAVMIGRAARGNPWIFAQAKAALEGQEQLRPPSAKVRIEAARRHAHLLAGQTGEQGSGSHAELSLHVNNHTNKNLVRMRKHAMWYISGLPGAASFRGRINTCVTLADFNALFDEMQRIEKNKSEI